MTREDVIAELVDANHILFNEKIVDGFGHVSARDPDNPSQFLLARSMAPALVQASDIMTFDLSGATVGSDDRRPYLERFIHGAIYSARPDVQSVVHSHSMAVIPFGVAKGRRLRPVSHMGGFLGEGPPVFEIRHAGGCSTDMLISNAGLGRELAKELAHESVVLMRGHGVTVVGATVRQAVFRAVYTEKSALLLSEALRLGEVEFLTLDEAVAAAHTNDGQIDRPWELWKLAAAAATHDRSNVSGGGG